MWVVQPCWVWAPARLGWAGWMMVSLLLIDQDSPESARLPDRRDRARNGGSGRQRRHGSTTTAQDFCGRLPRRQAMSASHTGSPWTRPISTDGLSAKLNPLSLSTTNSLVFLVNFFPFKRMRKVGISHRPNFTNNENSPVSSLSADWGKPSQSGGDTIMGLGVMSFRRSARGSRPSKAGSKDRFHDVGRDKCQTSTSTSTFTTTWGSESGAGPYFSQATWLLWNLSFSSGEAEDVCAWHGNATRAHSRAQSTFVASQIESDSCSADGGQ
ncbi:hypothetical protein CORC01_06805 [Colletotrichum orchidophilum]|uniref:Secreted protein n=1 Tax=Colletotrichum orchidophilum TaxID=1209926 RepID=A0A1G4B9I3_9PEZI|nr:uncharacterized protein CORC01_06805 [Colletotrichum orchidophilum]OHE97942.1 hypothetical protein CORC01_06805 [Colletotrichum orchidophilum]